MKIGQPGEMPVGLAQPAPTHAPKGGAAKAAAQPANPSARASTGSSVALTMSSRVGSLQKAGQSDEPDVDMEKVDAMRSAIADGSFQVNAQSIADKLLANAQEMLNRSKH